MPNEFSSKTCKEANCTRIGKRMKSLSNLKHIDLQRVPIHIGPTRSKGGCAVRALAITHCRSYASCYNRIYRFCRTDPTLGSPIELHGKFFEILGYKYYFIEEGSTPNKLVVQHPILDFDFSLLGTGVYIAKTEWPHLTVNKGGIMFSFGAHFSALKIQRVGGRARVIIMDSVNTEKHYLKGLYHIFDRPILI